MNPSTKQKLLTEVIRVASDTLTAAQARCIILHYVGGWSEDKIAKEYEVAGSQVHLCLWGQKTQRVPTVVDANGVRRHPSLAEMIGKARNNTIVGGGAVSRFSSALATDPVIQQLIAAHKPDPNYATDTGGKSSKGWFVGARPDHFPYLAVLWIAFDHADAEGKLSVVDLQRVTSPPVAQASLGPLQTLGFIWTDGVSIQIRKTPLGVFQPVVSSTFAAPSGEATDVNGESHDNIEDALIASLDASSI